MYFALIGDGLRDCVEARHGSRSMEVTVSISHSCWADVGGEALEGEVSSNTTDDHFVVSSEVLSCDLWGCLADHFALF